MEEIKNYIIKFNCGGRIYETTRSTIETYPDTFLCKLISGQMPTTLDEKGRIFIDRDPKVFNDVLNFYRYGIVPTRRTTIQQLDFEFFGIVEYKQPVTIMVKGVQVTLENK